MGTFVLAARGPFSLAASIRFLEGFTAAERGKAPRRGFVTNFIALPCPGRFAAS